MMRLQGMRHHGALAVLVFEQIPAHVCEFVEEGREVTHARLKTVFA